MVLHASAPKSSRLRFLVGTRAEQFFVEKTYLTWNETQDKRAYLHHEIGEGSVVFVRLIAPTASRHAIPIPYQIESVTKANVTGMWEVGLLRLCPRL